MTPARAFVAAAFAVVWFAPSAPAQTSSALRCVQTERTTQQACIARTRAECNAAFQAAVPPCFGANADCAIGCQSGQVGCASGPDGAKQGCEQACTASQRSAAKVCSNRADPRKCNVGVKLKGLKCRQKCQRNVSAALTGCAQAFDSCLKSCAGQ